MLMYEFAVDINDWIRGTFVLVKNAKTRLGDLYSYYGHS